MRQPVQSDRAPKAIGPYSQAILSGDTLYLSMQIPIDPKEGRIVAEDIADQTHRVMGNLEAVLEAAGMTFEQVVKTTIFLTSLDDFPRVNEVYGGYFPQAKGDPDGPSPPARATVQAAALPLGAKIGIEAIARK
jgi:2-iminobutanoate/2-iminopropanoate deaminase